MSNFYKKQAQELAIAFAREVAELTGETSSKLYQWGKELGLPVPKARQTFYSHMERNDWIRESGASSTESCRMGSYPMSCQLRLRVVSLKTQFRQDKKRNTTRQLIMLLGYEVCSGLIHFQLYRGTDFSGDAKDTPVCGRIPPATVAAFVEECGKMVGLPIRQVLFTQKIMDFAPKAGKVAYLSLAVGEMIHRGRKEEAGDNELPCSFDSKHSYRTKAGEHPFIIWCVDTNAKALTSYLSDLVKQHNKAVALPVLEAARQALESRWSNSLATAKVRHGSSRFAMRLPPLLQRMKKHEYALKEVSVDALRFHTTLHEVRFYKRSYEDFFAFPGDRGRLATTGALGDMAT